MGEARPPFSSCLLSAPTVPTTHAHNSEAKTEKGKYKPNQNKNKNTGNGFRAHTRVCQPRAARRKHTGHGPNHKTANPKEARECSVLFRVFAELWQWQSGAIPLHVGTSALGSFRRLSHHPSIPPPDTEFCSFTCHNTNKTTILFLLKVACLLLCEGFETDAALDFK